MLVRNCTKLIFVSLPYTGTCICKYVLALCRKQKQMKRMTDWDNIAEGQALGRRMDVLRQEESEEWTMSLKEAVKSALTHRILTTRG